MKTILVSEFKAKCIAALKEVRRTREPMMVTLRGEPLALIEPPSGLRREKRLGALKGKITICCDLVKADTTADWKIE